ncbi:MAG TPA: glycosyltransferase, partial [Terriglobia bacterium]|nr:glycosyltransferase [Terriglobia bacterium]
MKPEVSVIIVNLNRRALLARCLDSLWQQTFSNFEVIIVDNASTDGSMEFLQTVREP